MPAQLEAVDIETAPLEVLRERDAVVEVEGEPVAREPVQQDNGSVAFCVSRDAG